MGEKKVHEVASGVTAFVHVREFVFGETGML